MMTNVTIPKTWYEEIKGKVKMENEYFYQSVMGIDVEVDVEEETFNRISTELGWM